ncbi:MAG TPA: hypothetical protein VJH23_02925 [archaeon]|nr:hypothetical protein [archaeon]
MAGLFAHEWIAKLVLGKLSKRGFISGYENIDDYFFGAIAPDIRYINNSGRDITHRPFGENSIFEALKVSSSSMPFIAGYETHLIVDGTWANDNGALGRSIYQNYGVNANNPIQKFSLYLAVDDYFQAEADWVFPFESSGNILRADDLSILLKLGFGQKDIAIFKAAAAAYVRAPGIINFRPFNILPNNFDETLLRKIADQIPAMTSFLKEFRDVSVEKCVESLERYL